MRLSEENLLTICESLAARGGYACAAATIGITEVTVFEWINKSRKDADANLREKSKFYFEWRGVADYFAPGHIGKARQEQIGSVEGLLRQELKEGRDEIVFSPQSGYPLQQLDSEWIGVSDDTMREQFLDPVRDRFRWTPPDANGIRQPIFLTRNTVLAASLRQKLISGLLPKIFGDKVAVSHQVNGAITHTYQPAAYVPIAERKLLADPNVIEGQFKEIEPEREDIAALRAEWRRRENDPNRITSPEDATRVPIGKPEETVFRPTREDAGEATAHDVPRDAKPRHTEMPRAPEPPGPSPSYTRREDPRTAGSRNPNDPRNRAVKVG